MLNLSPVLPTPLPDALAAVRADIKKLKKAEEVLRDQILADREARVGIRFHAIASDHVRTTVDWQGLARSLGATEQTIAAYTKNTAYQKVDVWELPSIKSMISALEGPLAVLDTETTGLNPEVDRLISIGILPGKIGGDTFHPGNSVAWTFNPGQPSHPRALQVHGLTQAYLAAFDPLDPIQLLDIEAHCDDRVVVIHNAAFDLGFLNAEAYRLGGSPIVFEVIDTRIISKLIWPGEKASLDAMAARLGVDVTEREQGIHDALGDCRILARCLPLLLAKLKEMV